MSVRAPIAGFALARGAFGAGLIAAPERVARGWIGDDAARAPVKVAIRALGARDLALSIGALAHGDERRAGPWLLAAAACDCVDLAVTLAAGAALTRRARAGAAMLAGGSAVAGAALVVATERRR
jgi:hypothetical protein